MPKRNERVCFIAQEPEAEAAQEPAQHRGFPLRVLPTCTLSHLGYTRRGQDRPGTEERQNVPGSPLFTEGDEALRCVTH